MLRLSMRSGKLKRNIILSLLDTSGMLQTLGYSLSHEGCITPNYLNKIVRQSLGKSAKTYILEQILAEACRQLKYTTLSVADIATQLHFDTATYFVRLFKKYMAMTPLEFREQREQS